MEKLDVAGADTLHLVALALGEGQLVMHPTETCYGLAVDIFNEKALEKLYQVKGMSIDKPVSILVNSLAMAEIYGRFSNLALELAKKYWPGPLSIMVPKKSSLPLFLNAGQDFVSIRFSSLEFCNQVIGAFKHPVTTTSANISGKRESYLPIGFVGVDLLVDGGELEQKSPSTIVKVDGGVVEVIRKGDIFISTAKVI